MEKNPIRYTNAETGSTMVVPAADVRRFVVKSNEYLLALNDIFGGVKLDLFLRLDQRNLSGFIGEVFVRFFAAEAKGLVVNPHPDGRPDLIDVSSRESLDYFKENCFSRCADGSVEPNKELLTPFRYGGVEVKATIGDRVSGYRERLRSERGLNDFAVRVPRVNYIRSINFWGHHSDCRNLIGLYYDYRGELGGVPQIMAVMHAELIPSEDWHKVSIGTPGSKKTSNTSLNSRGVSKLLNNPIIVPNDSAYQERLRRIGLRN